jgi:hypothetical protein
VKRVSIRPENAHQAHLLHLLRATVPISRAGSGEAVHLSRSRPAVERERLTDIGLVESGGLAASRGGRRSGIVRLDSSLRFIDIDASSADVAVTDPELRFLPVVFSEMVPEAGKVGAARMISDSVFNGSEG